MTIACDLDGVLAEYNMPTHHLFSKWGPMRPMLGDPDRWFWYDAYGATAEMIAAAGIQHPSQLEAKHLVRRVSATEIRLFSHLHYFLKPGELLSGNIEGEFYERIWRMALSDSFAANGA